MGWGETDNLQTRFALGGMISSAVMSMVELTGGLEDSKALRGKLLEWIMMDLM
jgi:hypothetical protein